MIVYACNIDWFQVNHFYRIQKRSPISDASAQSLGVFFTYDYANFSRQISKTHSLPHCHPLTIHQLSLYILPRSSHQRELDARLTQICLQGIYCCTQPVLMDPTYFPQN